MTSYPCPFCRTRADVDTGCPGCGRGPDPDAAEVVRLDAEIGVQNARLAAARFSVEAAETQLRQIWRRRHEAAARVRANVASGTSATLAAGPAGGPAGSAILAGGPAPRAEEASTRLVQNVLFLLGGLLLGIAAIVFTAVAWSQFGVGGRAVLLAVFTGAALAVPPLALRRGLAATAETFAAVGLLLVLLDGYAAWYVNLFGVANYSAFGYAGAVCAVTAAVAAGYEQATGLVGPRFAALVVAQPVLPLLVAPLHPEWTGWSFTCAAVAVLNLAVVHMRRSPLTPVGIAAYVLGGFSVLAAGFAALTALVLASRAASAAAAGAALVTAALVVLAAAVLAAAVPARVVLLRSIAGGLLVVALGIAGGRFAALLSQHAAPVAVAGVVALLAFAVMGVPPAVRRGPWLGALVIVAVPGFAALVGVAGAARYSLDAAQPFFGAGLGTRVDGADWRLPVTAALLTAGLIALLPASWRRTAVLGGAGLLAVTVPAGFALPWWSAPGVEMLVAACALGFAARAAAQGLSTGAASAPAAGAAPTPSVALAAGDPAGSSVVSGVGDPAASSVASAAGGPAASSVAGGPGASSVASAAGGPGASSAAGGPGASSVAGGPAASSVAFAGGGPAASSVVSGAGTARSAQAGRPGDAAAAPAELAWLVATVMVLVAHAVSVGFGRPVVAAATFGAVVLLGFGAAVAAWSGPRRRDLGGVSLAVALFVVPALAWTFTAALSLPAVTQSRAVLGSAVTVVAALRLIARRWADYRPFALAAVLLALASAPVWALASGDSPAIYAGIALLLVAATLPAGRAWAPPAAVPLGLALLVSVAPSLFTVLVAPYAWLGRIWAGRPVGVGIDPASVGHVARADVVALALVAAAASSAALLLQGRRTAALAAAPVLAVTFPAALAVAGVPWPGVPAAMLLVGLTGLLTVALRPPFDSGTGRLGAAGAGKAPRAAGLILTAMSALLASAGLTAALPTRASTLAALGAVLVAGAVAGVAARDLPARLAGWLSAVGAALAFAFTAGRAFELSVPATAFPVLAVAAVALAVGALLDDRRPVEARAVQAAAHAGAVAALLLTVGSVRYAAVVCTLWGLAIGVRALRSGQAPVTRRVLVVAAATSELFGWWLLIKAEQVSTLEAYTLPAAAVALLAGWLARRTRPDLNSWTGYGPALAAALLPTLAAVLVGGGQPERRLLLGLAALAVVLVGANARLQAPVVAGGAVLVAVALHELVLVWDLLPRWIPLAAAGLLLVALAMTLERRRRDLARVRAALTRMS